MNRSRLIMAAVPACILILAGGCGKEENLLIAGDFEQVSELQKSPEGWFATVVPPLKEFVAFEWDDQVAHSGKRSVSLAIDASHPDDQVHYNWTAPVPACRPGGRYELSGWIKTENLTAPAFIMFQFWGEDKSSMVGFASTQGDYNVTGTSDWQQVGVVFTVPDDTGDVRIRAGIAAPDNRGGKVWFDDLRIIEIR